MYKLLGSSNIYPRGIILNKLKHIMETVVFQINKIQQRNRLF